MSILALFGLALGLTVLLSWYLSLTIARPILRLAGAAAADARRPGPLRQRAGAAAGRGATRSARSPRRSPNQRQRAVGADGRDRAFRRRRRARDQEPAVLDPQRDRNAAPHRGPGAAQRQLLAIIAEDVTRLDRLISDISDASRDRRRAVARRRRTRSTWRRSCTRLRKSTRRRASRERPAAGGRCARRRCGRAGGGGPAGAGAAQPDRQRAVLQPAERPDLAARPRGTDGMVEISVEDEGPGIPEAQAGAHLRPLLFRAAAGREVRPALRPRPVDQPADRRGAAGPDLRREPPRHDGNMLGARFTVRLPKA